MYRSLTQGEDSYIEKTAVNVWGANDDDNGAAKKKLDTLFQTLGGLEHPTFIKNGQSSENESAIINATAYISGLEIAHALNMPRKSISGLPVFQCAEFARNVISSTEINGSKTKERPHVIKRGDIYHMRKPEAGAVELKQDSLSSHTFITGSTGSGKSNTVYHILSKLSVPFLVIETAKGEYKSVDFGDDSVSVYGTNPQKTELLRLNPFSFSNDVHVLEHIDRLVEIFNACWPMYAAMPAVLKAAVETAYTNVGWSLTRSECKPRYFPTFKDVMKALPEVINIKGFSHDTQSDYIGALLTRVESLTNGINGQVLCAEDDLPDSELFDRNVIVDISRVGSMETKALLMGVLILKLQEYRMTQRSEGEIEANSGLRHITVLEEAHNLLRRTTTDQNQTSSNLQGKSVEMLTKPVANKWYKITVCYYAIKIKLLSVILIEIPKRSKNRVRRRSRF